MFSVVHIEGLSGNNLPIGILKVNLFLIINPKANCKNDLVSMVLIALIMNKKNYFHTSHGNRSSNAFQINWTDR